MIGDDTETGCCFRVCSSTRTHSSLRGSVSFCSIGCVLAMKFGGEARIHKISKTEKFLMEKNVNVQNTKKLIICYVDIFSLGGTPSPKVRGLEVRLPQKSFMGLEPKLEDLYTKVY